jgi:hypothetical protein
MRLIRTIVLASVSFLGLAAAAPLAQARMVCRDVVDEAPPPLPEYEQPPIPGPDYIWTPGYWSESDDSGYYWVPGTWALPPRPGLLWTPGYWGWSDGAFVFHAGYWGATVGFYGGVNYGFGYGGAGYQGGYWRGDHFFYNRTVNNINNVAINNVYEQQVVVNQGPRVSYHGGPGGIVATPSQEEAAVARQERIPPTQEQLHHSQMAAKDPALQLRQNHGRPPIAATARPAEFSGAGAGGALAPTPRAPGQFEPPKAGIAGRPPATGLSPKAPQAPYMPPAMPHPPAGTPHAMPPAPHMAPPAPLPSGGMPHALPQEPHMAPPMPHPPGGMPRALPQEPHMAPPMPHPPGGMPRALPQEPHMAPPMPHPPGGMPRALPREPHPGPAERGGPGPAERGRPGQEPRF